MPSKIKIVAAAAGVLTLAATATAAAIGWRSYKQTGSAIPQSVRACVAKIHAPRKADDEL